jgi:Ca-activated chloride channel family protein
MRRIVLLLLLAVCSISAFSQTQGTLEAFNKKGNALGASPLKRTSVKADVSGFLARVKVTQEFENKFNQPIEAVYTFPLPNDAAVDDMTMLVGTRTIRGKIMRRDEARKVYEAAKTEGKTASLLDQERPNVFTQAVANILPNEKIVVEISYVETLKYEDGEYEFVFPMTVAPRYIPSSVNPDDAGKISPPIAKNRAGHDVSIEVNLNAGVPVEAIRSGSHEIKTLNLSPNTAKISLKNEVEIPNRDFVLRYDVTGKRIEDAVLTHRDARGGFFSLILQPPDKFATEDVTSKEIVFVLDTSGSMSGFPIEKAKEAMKLSLENLYPNDTFNLITFAGDTHVLFEQPVPATQANLEKAKAFLESRQGGGGTEMMAAIKAALQPSDAQDHIRIVCFMTDGEVGNDLEIIGEVQKYKNARVFSFGIGSSVNRFLLDKIAEEGRGEAEYVALTDDGSKAAKRFYERVRTPLLTDVSIDWNGLPVADVYPNRISDLFSAKPVVIHGRYTKGASGTIKLKGKVGGQDLVREIAVNLPAGESGNDVLATLWARTRIDDLTAKDYQGVQDGRAKPEVQNTITNIGLEYRLLTQFTSFVAVEEVIKTQGGKLIKVEVPVEFPDGMNRKTTLGDANEIVEISSSSANLSVTSKSVSSLPPNNRAIASGNGSGIGNGGMIAQSGAGRRNSRKSLGAKPNSGASVTNLTLSPGSKVLSGGVVNGQAANLPKPAYPPAAKAIRAGGVVSVQVTIDEIGNVISASAISGHPLLHQAALQAAGQAKFFPTLVSGKAVKVQSVIIYNFVDTQNATTVTLGEMRIDEKDLLKPFSPEEKQRQMLAEKLHVWIYALTERLQKGENAQAANEAKFVFGGKADVQIWFSNKTPEAVERLKQLGFEVLENKRSRIIVGRIAVEKITAVAEIAEVQYVLPKIK